MPQTQEEFYFWHPYERMDVLVWAHARGTRRRRSASASDLAAAEVGAAYAEIERRRVATAYLHAPAVVVEPRG